MPKQFPPRRDADGEPVCRFCGGALSGKRSSWCSDACRLDALLCCGFGVRARVRKRDKGICARCGRDCYGHKRKFKRALERCQRPDCALERVRRVDRLLKWTGLTPSEAIRSFWQAHHKLAVADGGGACGLDNYETLCVWCHKREHENDVR